MYPVAYIRRSVARTGDPGDVSREFQTEKVRALANGDGPTLRIIDGDWGISGSREKTPKRLAFAALMESIERGEVATLYAYSSDRIARSVTAASLLFDACERAGVTIVTGEGRFAPGDRMARQMFQFLAMQNEGQLDAMTEKSDATARKRKERGDRMGRAPYGYKHAMVDGRSVLVPREGESPAHVVDVFVREGAYLSAARALNEEGYPTRFAGKAWDPTTVRNVVRRERPELAPVRPRRGARTRSTRLFAGLLVCRCGTTLTSAPTKWGVQYYCRLGHHGKHPNPYMLAESKVLAWAKEEVARFGSQVHVEYKDVQRQANASLDALADRRARILQMFEDGDIDRAEKSRRLAALDAQLPAVESARRISTFTLRGKVNWKGDPAEVNAELRNLWQRVELGDDMQPVRAVYAPGMDPDAHQADQEAAEAEADRLGRVGRAGEAYVDRERVQ